jgi:hypothetical protein
MKNEYAQCGLNSFILDQEICKTGLMEETLVSVAHFPKLYEETKESNFYSNIKLLNIITWKSGDLCEFRTFNEKDVKLKGKGVPVVN